jgi:hypothetical protein
MPQIMRRMRYHEPKIFETYYRRSAPSYRYHISRFKADAANLVESGPLVWCLWLVDIVQSFHFDLSINLFSSRELWTVMPNSRELQDVYRHLLDDRVPRERHILAAASQEDMLLLLMALAADLLYARRSLGQVNRPVAPETRKGPCDNSLRPFSPQMELRRIEDQLSLAVDKWYRSFKANVSPEILVLYHYVKIYLCFDQLLSLPQTAGYPGSTPSLPMSRNLSISEIAVREAWHVLDSAAAWSQKSHADQLCPIWLPITVFHAGLVVWVHFTTCNAKTPAAYSSPRVLLAFKVELDGMRWPCCVEMSATFARLITATSSSQEQ